MANIRVLLNRLSTHLGTVKGMIEIENSVNDQSANMLFESKMMDIWNVTTGTELRNANLIEKNYPGIDGIDDRNKLMVQVTSTFSAAKIEHTISKIIAHKLYSKYDRLIFLFLKDKKPLGEKVKKSIALKIGDKFKFDFKNDIIDLKDIYSIHHINQDLQKTHLVVGLLDEVLNYIPAQKESGFDALSVSFHEEELDNVFLLVDVIIKEGINVYITSKKLYDKFSEENHPLKDFIIYVDSQQHIDHINFCIVVLSNSYFYQNFERSKDEFSCHLLQSAVDNECKIDAVSFDHFLKKKVKESGILTSYRTIQTNNITATVTKILSNKITQAAFGNISVEEIRKELTNAHHNFLTSIIDDNPDFILMNLKMIDQDDVELNYMVLSKDYTLTAVTNTFERRFKDKYSRNLNVLVPKDFSHRTRRRLDLVKQSLSTTKVYYIDEHLFDKRLKSLVQEKILNTDRFISPVVRHNDEYLRINDIIYWIINNSDSSIAIINGSGGIGKTTICEKIHDVIIDEHDRNIVIFIDASQYIDVFKKSDQSNETEYDLYNIFKACHPHASIIDENSFFLNYSLGNIIIIFDGIDEVISTIPSFSLEKFLANLKALKSRLGKGKILINCRDTYVNDLRKFYEEDDENLIQIYELLPFDDNLARKFFENHLDDQESVKTCLKLAKDFYPDDKGSQYVYPPFILEIIVDIVDQDFDYEAVSGESKSKVLSLKEHHDTLIFKICDREIIKKEKHGFQLDIDNQVRFLCALAIEEKGEINSDDFHQILDHIGLRDRTNEVAKGLLDHPLLLKINGKHFFRFDFFKTYFKALSIFNLLRGQFSGKLTESTIKTLALECNYNSVISKTIIQKVTNSTSSELLIRCSKDIIAGIIDFHRTNSDSNSIIKKKSISNIFLMLLKSFNPAHYSNAKLLHDLFAAKEKDSISNFYFVDVSEDSLITMDFSGLYFSNSEIRNFPNFFNCTFNEDTFFDETCHIDNVYSNKINLKSIKATKNNFDAKIKGDNSVFRILKMKGDGEIDVRNYFKEYLRNFSSQRTLNLEISEKMISMIGDEFITVKLISQILEDNDVVRRTHEGQIIINEKLKFKIIKFLTQGLMFTELSRSIGELRKKSVTGDF